MLLAGGKVYLADPGSKHHFSYWHRYKWTLFTPRGNTLAWKPLESLDNTARHWQLSQCPSPPPDHHGLSSLWQPDDSNKIPCPSSLPCKQYRDNTVPCHAFIPAPWYRTSLLSLLLSSILSKRWQKTPFQCYSWQTKHLHNPTLDPMKTKVFSCLIPCRKG
jgi:hypothetical protein